MVDWEMMAAAREAVAVPEVEMAVARVALAEERTAAGEVAAEVKQVVDVAAEVKAAGAVASSAARRVVVAAAAERTARTQCTLKGRTCCSTLPCGSHTIPRTRVARAVETEMEALLVAWAMEEEAMEVERVAVMEAVTEAVLAEWAMEEEATEVERAEAARAAAGREEVKALEEMWVASSVAL